MSSLRRIRLCRRADVSPRKGESIQKIGVRSAHLTLNATRIEILANNQLKNSMVKILRFKFNYSNTSDTCSNYTMHYCI